jgi:hypothetical protein
MLSPAGLSTFTTSAPKSPSSCVAEGPITTVVRSSTRTPRNGPVAAIGSSGQTPFERLVMDAALPGNHSPLRISIRLHEDINRAMAALSTMQERTVHVPHAVR